MKNILFAEHYEMVAVDTDGMRRQQASDLGALAFSSLQEAPEANMYLIAVKPQDIDGLLAEMREVIREGVVVVSIAAGITVSHLKRQLPGARVVRAMPNTPLVAGEGMTALSIPENVPERLQAKIKKIFSFSGETEIIDEKFMDAVTAVSGSGPAYLFYLAEEMKEFLTAKGMDSAQAVKFVSRTVLGAGKLMVESDRSFRQLRENVTSPGGTTAEALKHMKEKRFKEIFAQALDKACEKSLQLSTEEFK